jgi:hypothetical protein
MKRMMKRIMKVCAASVLEGFSHSIPFCRPPIMAAPASVPQMLPTPPTTTVMKLCTM